MVADPLQQEVRAEDVGLDEVAGLHDGAVDVRLGGEVDDRLAALGRTRDGIGVADRAVHEAVALAVGDLGQVRGIAGVRERVEVDDLDVVVASEQAPHEMRADEPAAAGHEDASHGSSALARAARQSRSPSLQCGSRGASACTVRRIEQAGRGAGRCSSLEEIGTTRARQPRLLHDRARRSRTSSSSRRRRGGRCRAGSARRARAWRARGAASPSGSRPGRRPRAISSRSAPRRSIVSRKLWPRGENTQAVRTTWASGCSVSERALARELGGAVDAARRDRRALVVAARGRRRRTRSRSRTRRARPRRPARRAPRDGCRTRWPARRRRDPTPRRRRRSRPRSAARARGGARRTRAATEPSSATSSSVASRRSRIGAEQQRELAAELAAAAGHEHSGHASRGESVGLVVDHRSRTRSSSQRTFCSSGSAGSYSSVTW